MDKKALLEAIYQRNENSISDFLGIEFTDVGEDYLCGKMPVNEKTRQPMGILHGGASVVLAETLGSVAANFAVDREKYYCVGLSINASHIRSVQEGNMVYGKATAIHLGRTTQIWEIELRNEDEKLTCKCRLTMAVLEKKA